MLYDDAPYIITYYANGLEAYRNDRFTGWVKQPKDTGTLIYQWGTWSYFDVAPVSAATEAESASAAPGASTAPSAAAGGNDATAQPASGSTGISTGLIIGLLVAVLVIVVLIVVVLRMRRTVTNEDRE
jgi:peptide/nickel transport system substrate-binding protein